MEESLYPNLSSMDFEPVGILATNNNNNTQQSPPPPSYEQSLQPAQHVPYNNQAYQAVPQYQYQQPQYHLNDQNTQMRQPGSYGQQEYKKNDTSTNTEYQATAPQSANYMQAVTSYPGQYNGQSTAVSATGNQVKPFTLWITAPKYEEKDKTIYFNFNLEITGTNLFHSFAKRFSELESYHTKFLKEFVSIQIPDFPPKHLTTNFKKPENIQMRQNELISYFRRLIAIPEVVISESFKQSFDIQPSEFLNTMLNISNQLLDTVAGAKQRELEKKESEERQEYLKTQNFHQQPMNLTQSHLGMIWLPCILNYSYSITLLLQDKFGDNDGILYGPTQQPWFLVEPNNSIFKNCQFIIANMNHEPVLFIEAKKQMMSTKYRIYRAAKIQGTEEDTLFKLSSVHFPTMGGAVIKTQGPKKGRKTDVLKTTRGVHIKRQQIVDNGMAVASVNNSNEFAYSVQFSPQADIIHYMGILVCLDRHSRR